MIKPIYRPGDIVKIVSHTIYEVKMISKGGLVCCKGVSERKEADNYQWRMRPYN